MAESLNWAVWCLSRSGWGVMSPIAVGVLKAMSAGRGQSTFGGVSVCAGYVGASTRLPPGRISASGSLSWAVKCWSRNGEGKTRLTAAGAPRGMSVARGPGGVRGGGGICRACANQDPDTAWKFFRGRVAEMGGVVLEPEWLGATKFHRCQCPNGHECSISPNRVQQGGSICQVCARIQANAQRSATARAEFYERVAAQGGVVLEPKWLGTTKPHRVRCAKGHEGSPTPGNLQRGTGICQQCGWMDRDVLYVTRNPVTCCVKFGITSRDGYARLRTHRVDGFTEVLRLITGLPEGLAVLTEQKIKLALAMADAEPMRGREYFSDEYLALIENEIGNWVPGAPIT